MKTRLKHFNSKVVLIKTGLPLNFKLVAMEERFEQQSGEKYLTNEDYELNEVDDNGVTWSVVNTWKLQTIKTTVWSKITVSKELAKLLGKTQLEIYTRSCNDLTQFNVAKVGKPSFDKVYDSMYELMKSIKLVPVVDNL